MLSLYLLVIAAIVSLFFFIRFLLLKQEVKKISQQLRDYTNQKTGKKIDVTLLDKNIEQLAVQINQLIDLHLIEKREKIRFEDEVKQNIANMSHDLRTPLTSILGYIQIAELAETPINEQKDALSIAKKRAKRLEMLLNDFFELSVIESADYQLTFQMVNINILIINALVGFYDRFNERNIEPAIEMPEKDLYVFSDESVITRVMDNLISNSLKHSNGNITITLQENDEKARLIVKNDAPSLTEKDAEHLFDRFYMADQSRNPHNTGLGLSIVKSLMDKTNGIVTSQLQDGQLSIICEWTLVE